MLQLHSTTADERNATQRSITGVTIGGILMMFFIFLAVSTTRAQEEFVNPPAKKIASMKFTMLSGGIVIIRATLDEFTDSLNFVLDTGSGGISLDSSTCNFLGLKREPSERIVRGIAGMRTVDFTYNHTLNFQNLTVEKLDFHINDYEILTSAYGMRIDGIIGFSFLRRYIVTIDYDDKMIDVYIPGTFKYPRGGLLLKPQFTTIPMQNAIVCDETIFSSKYYFDIGAGLCMLLNEDLVADSNLLKKKRKLYKTHAEGLGGKAEMKLTVIKEMRLGPYRFRKVPIHIFEDAYNLTNYPVLGGLIGNDILRRFNIILNYPEQQIYIKPNEHYSDSFDYSYTGLGMYMINGHIVVTDIVKNSPAENAGFMINDIVLGVNNNFTNNIQAYKTLLQTPRSRLKIVVLREGKPEELLLNVRSILR